MSDPATLPGCVPYVLRAGEGLSHNVAGQVIRTLAGVEETAGGFGAVVCEATVDRMPIPMHWHEREHDTWFVTRGRMRVWCRDGGRVMAPGDFAYVVPGDTHSYQCISPRTQFFGVVAPGGWEQFFADAGEVWGLTAMPPADRPVDFARMGPAMGKHRIMRVADPVFAAPTPIGDTDRALPAGHASYWLEAGYGRRRTLAGHLSTAVITAAQSNGLFDMRVVEGGRGATMPTLRHAATHLVIHGLAGAVTVAMDGAEHRLEAGDTANIPAGTAYATRIESGAARWIATSSGGDGYAFWDAAGQDAPGYAFLDGDGADAGAALAGSGVDATLA